MSLVQVARDALKEIPFADVLRERVSLALDRLAEAEAKIETLQSENGGLKSELERERVNHEQTKQELQRLKDQLQEEIRFVHDVEYRRGIRTGGKWQPFCPKCHLPIMMPEGFTNRFACCNDSACGWSSGVISGSIQNEVRSLT
jgi:hypothetical protein